MWVTISDRFAYEMGEGGWVCGVVPYESEHQDLEAFLDGISEAATGSIAGLEDIGYTVMAGRCFFRARLSGHVLEEASEIDIKDDAQKKRLVEILALQHGLSDVESKHVEDTIGIVYENECAIELSRGRELRAPAFPEECSYVRFTIPGVTPIETAFWNCDEWEQAPTDVMGAIIGAIQGAQP